MKTITKEEFLAIFNKATAVDYAGEYMSIQDDDDDFIFLPNWDGGEEVRFSKEVLNDGVEVNGFGDLFRFKVDECEQFGLLSQLVF